MLKAKDAEFEVTSTPMSNSIPVSISKQAADEECAKDEWPKDVMNLFLVNEYSGLSNANGLYLAKGYLNNQTALNTVLVN